MERIDSIKIKVTRKKEITEDYFLLNEMADGLVIVQSKGNELYGVIDKNGNEVIPCKYEELKDFSEELVLVMKNEKWGLVDKNGNEVVPCKYEKARYFSDKMSAVQKNWLWGFIDENGNEVIPCKYDWGREFSEGLAVVGTCRFGFVVDYFGFIDKEGNEVIPCKYDYAESFKDGLAYVTKNCFEFFYIDKKGNRVEPYFEDSNIINYDKVVTEELYISNEEEIPDDCLSIEILAYNSLLVLNNGDRVEIEEPTKEEWKKEVSKIIEQEFSILENLENNISSAFARKKCIK